jgi:hypothetical protein
MSHPIEPPLGALRLWATSWREWLDEVKSYPVQVNSPRRRDANLRFGGLNEVACGDGRYAWAFLKVTAVAYVPS